MSWVAPLKWREGYRALNHNERRPQRPKGGRRKECAHRFAQHDNEE